MNSALVCICERYREKGNKVKRSPLVSNTSASGTVHRDMMMYSFNKDVCRRQIKSCLIFTSSYVCKGSASGCQRMEEKVKKKKEKESDTCLVHRYKGGRCCLALMDNPTGATVRQAGVKQQEKPICKNNHRKQQRHFVSLTDIGRKYSK